MVTVKRRDGYRYPTIHYSTPNQVEHGRLLNFSVDNVGGDGIVLYRYQTSQYSSQRGYSRVDSARYLSKTE